MLAANYYSPGLAIIYLATYIIVTAPLFVILSKLNIPHPHFLISHITTDQTNTSLLILLTLTLAGIPPFAAFIPKVFTLFFLTQVHLPLALLIVLTAAITIYFYLNILTAFPLTTLLFPAPTKPANNHLPLLILSSVTLNLLPITLLLLYALAILH